MRRVFNDEWKPVLSLMYDSTKHLIRGVPEKDMNAAFLETTFITARNKLEEKYPNLFKTTASRQWKVSTWSKNVRRENRMRSD